MSESDTLLYLDGVTVTFDGFRALNALSLYLEKGEMRAVIGPNGAGKTTTLKAIAGVLPFTGRIEFDGAPLRPGRAEERPGQGLCLVPEGRGILARMTVHENLLMGGYCRKGGAPDKEINAVYERFPVLQERSAVPAGLLSGGEQQMLAIGRALLAKPRLLMLDEPSLGLAPLMVERVFGIVKDLRAAGITILIIEQKARQTLAIADRACVLETGRIVVTDEAARLKGDAALARAYLGTGAK